MNAWTEDQIKMLENLYPNNNNEYISEVLCKSKSSISNMSFRLGFKKTMDYRSNSQSKRNKNRTRNLNFENLEKISSKYKSRSEFQKMDSSAYSTARKMGILNIICDHMIMKSFSIPQMILLKICKYLFKCEIIYNDRKSIKPYELDILIPEYKISFEYNGKYWHEDDVIDKVKMCESIEILLININENNRNYDIDIKNQLYKQIGEVNSHCMLNISKDDIYQIETSSVYQNLYNKEEARLLCLKYDDISIFKKENKKLYHILQKSKILEEYTSHMKKKIKWNLKLAESEVKKYEKISDFIEMSTGCYLFIKRNNLEYLLSNLQYKSIRRDLEKSIDDLRIGKYKSKYELRKKDRNLFSYLKGKIGLDELGNLIDKYRSDNNL